MTTTRSAAARAASDHDGTESSVTVCQPISHPVLRSVDPVNVFQFFRDRERYEIKVQEKKKEVPTLTTATYRVLVDPGMLRRMHCLGNFKSISPNSAASDFTCNEIEIWVRGMVKNNDKKYDPAIVEKALATLRAPMSIADPEARMMEYCNDFFTRLEFVRYENFKDDNSKKTVQLLQEKLFPKSLKSVMQQALEYQETLRKDVVAYVEMLCIESKAYEKYKHEDIPLTKDKSNGKPSGLGANRDPAIKKRAERGTEGLEGRTVRMANNILYASTRYAKRKEDATTSSMNASGRPESMAKNYWKSSRPRRRRIKKARVRTGSPMIEKMQV